MLVNHFVGFIIKVAVLAQLVVFSSCAGKQEKIITVMNDSIEEALMNANKHVVTTEDRQIDDFVARMNWAVDKTPTGVRYLIYKKGAGTPITKDQILTISYEMKSLSGDVIYSSANEGNKTFRMGKGEVESGLEEVLTLMNTGDKAKVIVPSYLAWGLTGDGNNIPPKTTLVYDLEILNSIKNK